jgi:hypothetical protein
MYSIGPQCESWFWSSVIVVRYKWVLLSACSSLDVEMEHETYTVHRYVFQTSQTDVDCAKFVWPASAWAIMLAPCVSFLLWRALKVNVRIGGSLQIWRDFVLVN